MTTIFAFSRHASSEDPASSTRLHKLLKIADEKRTLLLNLPRVRHSLPQKNIRDNYAKKCFLARHKQECIAIVRYLTDW